MPVISSEARFWAVSTTGLGIGYSPPADCRLAEVGCSVGRRAPAARLGFTMVGKFLTWCG